MARSFDLLASPPIYGGFVYLACPRWALGVNGQPIGTSPGTPTEIRGALRIGKISELRIESGTPGVPGSAFFFYFFAAHLRWFRVFSIAAFGVGR